MPKAVKLFGGVDVVGAGAATLGVLAQFKVSGI
jgi:hypothetical protein